MNCPAGGDHVLAFDLLANEQHHRLYINEGLLSGCYPKDIPSPVPRHICSCSWSYLHFSGQTLLVSINGPCPSRLESVELEWLWVKTRSPPSEHPNASTKIGNLKWGVNSPNPTKMGSRLTVLTCPVLVHHFGEALHRLLLCQQHLGRPAPRKRPKSTPPTNNSKSFQVILMNSNTWL